MNLSNTIEFIKEIGFDEVHTTDLFSKEDIYLKWGYPDNTAYTRYFEFLNNYKNEKLFVYMEVGAVNHYPFKYHEQLDDTKVEEQDLEHNFADQDLLKSTWLQDKYLGEAYKKYYLPEYAESSALLIFGDNPWPVGKHKNNNLNISDAYEENLLTSMVVVYPNNIREKDKGKVITTHYGGNEITRFILDIAGLSNKENISISQSTGETESGTQCILSVQPFTQKKIVIKLYPYKYLIDVYSQNIVKFDLSNDPDEISPVASDKSFEELLTLCQ